MSAVGRAIRVAVAWAMVGPLLGQDGIAPNVGGAAPSLEPMAAVTAQATGSVGAVAAPVGAPSGSVAAAASGQSAPTGQVAMTEGAAASLTRVDSFALDAAADKIDFRTMDIPAAAGQAVLVAAMEKTFFSEKARPSLTARLASENTEMQRVVSLKMVGGPLEPLAVTTFEVRSGGVDGKRDQLGRGVPVGQKFDLTFVWGGGRLEIRVDGVPRYRGQMEFVPVFFHVQVQSGRASVESIQFEAARFTERGATGSRRQKK